MPRQNRQQSPHDMFILEFKQEKYFSIDYCVQVLEIERQVLS